jgi:hypothetical protein
MKQIRKGSVACKACGYTWYPDASRWRNTSLSNGGKVLHCPACNATNRLDKLKLKEILRLAAFRKRLIELGKP